MSALRSAMSDLSKGVFLAIIALLISADLLEISNCNLARAAFVVSPAPSVGAPTGNGGGDCEVGEAGGDSDAAVVAVGGGGVELVAPESILAF